MLSEHRFLVYVFVCWADIMSGRVDPRKLVSAVTGQHGTTRPDILSRQGGRQLSSWHIE